jgi:uncharacterized membrane protein YgdD (TMEM256/DUF423 family)
MNPRRWIVLAALLGALAVALGALGAHGLQGRLRAALDEPAHAARLRETIDTGVRPQTRAERLAEAYDTAARYHLAHAIALVFVGCSPLATGRRALQAAGCCFVCGIGLFSGFLYLWAVTLDEFRWMVHPVPFGGMLLIAGWVLLAVAHCCPTNASTPAAPSSRGAE